MGWRILVLGGGMMQFNEKKHSFLALATNGKNE
jgi:hypothetical protein